MVEFLPSADGPPAEQLPVGRPPWRRWAQRAVLAGLACAAATLVVVDAGDHRAKQQPDLPRLKPVHVTTYAPWHERAISGGGGAYIF